MRRDLPSRFECMVLSANASLTTEDVMVRGLFVAATGGITITLPTPNEPINAAECVVVNNTNSNVAIACVNGFPNNGDSITLAAGASAFLYCSQLSTTVYRWAAVGATAS
ncbi:MAG: hypothetical protein AB1473_19045 [Thermodesulfobacteriota bacterium]